MLDDDSQKFKLVGISIDAEVGRCNQLLSICRPMNFKCYPVEHPVENFGTAVVAFRAMKMKHMRKFVYPQVNVIVP